MNSPRIIKVPTFSDPRGNLSFLESNNHIPFDVKRIYYLHNMPFGSERGSHAHKTLEQIVIAINGEFTLQLNNGKEIISYTLDNPTNALYIPKMHWRDLYGFSPNAICLVLASDFYSEDDYIRNFDAFKKITLPTEK